MWVPSNGCEGSKSAELGGPTLTLCAYSPAFPAHRVNGPDYLESIGAQAEECLHPLRGCGDDRDQVTRTDLRFQNLRAAVRDLSMLTARARARSKRRTEARRQGSQVRGCVPRHSDRAVAGDGKEALNPCGLPAVFDLKVLRGQAGNRPAILKSVTNTGTATKLTSDPKVRGGFF